MAKQRLRGQLVYLYMYVFRTYLSTYIICLVTITQTLLSLGSDGHVLVVPRYYLSYKPLPLPLILDLYFTITIIYSPFFQTIYPLIWKHGKF